MPEVMIRVAARYVRTGQAGSRSFNRGASMDHVYKTIELVGSSTTGMEDAVQKAIAKAAETVRNLRWFQVLDTRGHIENGRVAHWQVTLKLGFTLEDE
jgi:dodecin